MNKTDINKLFYIDKDYSEIKEEAAVNPDNRKFEMLAKIYLWNGNLIKAYEYFEKNENMYGCAYCRFLGNEIQSSKTLLGLIKNSSSAANWLSCLINIVEDNNKNYAPPTYFQIRNFYEQDLDMLFVYKRKEFIEKIIKQNPYFENYNKEIYKYSARVLLNNNCIKEAEILLKRSLDIFYADPETHYLLGELYLKNKDLRKAKHEFERANEVNGRYFPAINKLSIFNQ